MIPEVELKEGIHALHLFYQIDRERWDEVSKAESESSMEALQTLCDANNEASHPRLRTFVNVGGKADLCFFFLAKTLGEVSAMQRKIERTFPVGALMPVYSFLSVTELSEYTSSEEDYHRMLTDEEKLEPGSEAYNERLEGIRKKLKEYQHYRLYPELPDWEIMGFYPMLKRRSGNDNWYRLGFDERKKLMGGHARVGRKYAGRVSQLITGATGLDDWEWGVTLMAHKTDDIKDIVYEMRFDEVTARFGEFGPFYINLRLEPKSIWEHLEL